MNTILDRLDFFRSVIQELQAFCGEEIAPVKQAPYEEVFIKVPMDCLHQAVAKLVERFSIRHLSTITADVVDETIVLHYHFWHRYGLTLTTELPREACEVTTVVDLVPGAAFYEREVYDMYGVTFVGHQDLRPLVLPDDWAEGAPMLKIQEGD